MFAGSSHSGRQALKVSAVPAFDPSPEYQVSQDLVPLNDFVNYAEEFVIRPPYQRKTVWSRAKQQALLDSLFRRFYIPRIVLREVRLTEERVVREVIDGQQRITTAQLFLEDHIPLPRSLEDVHSALPRKRYSELSVEFRRFVDRLSYSADIVRGVADPRDGRHQELASEVFWRLQQGESLTYMEVAHSRLSSLSRNFVVKYADDISFDFDSYQALDNNSHKHPFFSVIDRKNDRMQHLALLTRLLIIEAQDGPADLVDTKISEFIDAHKVADGIGNLAFETQATAQGALRTMGVFYEVFKDDVAHTDGRGLPELRIEYFIVSVYLLLRHLLKHYVFEQNERILFRAFVLAFHTRWSARREDDNEILNFSDHRQQTGNDVELRHRVLRQLFFEYASAQGHEMLTRDERRSFSEAERIAIYRRDDGLCQVCLKEGKPEPEARVPWREYEADHVIPHHLGGRTNSENARVLCRFHNRSRGARLEPTAA
jgi:hypothetical protein